MPGSNICWPAEASTAPREVRMLGGIEGRPLSARRPASLVTTWRGRLGAALTAGRPVLAQLRAQAGHMAPPQLPRRVGCRGVARRRGVRGSDRALRRIDWAGPARKRGPAFVAVVCCKRPARIRACFLPASAGGLPGCVPGGWSGTRSEAGARGADRAFAHFKATGVGDHPGAAGRPDRWAIDCGFGGCNSAGSYGLRSCGPQAGAAWAGLQRPRPVVLGTSREIFIFLLF